MLWGLPLPTPKHPKIQLLKTFITAQRLLAGRKWLIQAGHGRKALLQAEAADCSASHCTSVGWGARLRSLRFSPSLDQWLDKKRSSHCDEHGPRQQAETRGFLKVWDPIWFTHCRRSLQFIGQSQSLG